MRECPYCGGSGWITHSDDTGTYTIADPMCEGTGQLPEGPPAPAAEPEGS